MGYLRGSECVFNWKFGPRKVRTQDSILESFPGVTGEARTVIPSEGEGQMSPAMQEVGWSETQEGAERPVRRLLELRGRVQAGGIRDGETGCVLGIFRR